jgi:hypothetical protein
MCDCYETQNCCLCDPFFDEYCPVGHDGDPAQNMHCTCWYDGDGCCRCKAPAMTD